MADDDEVQMERLTAQVSNKDVVSWPLEKRTRVEDRGGQKSQRL